jgi:hypothetical protein
MNSLSYFLFTIPLLHYFNISQTRGPAQRKLRQLYPLHSVLPQFQAFSDENEGMELVKQFAYN